MRLYRTIFTRWHAGYMKPAKIDALGLSFEISAGNDDDVIVYHDKEYIYIVSENNRLDYIGLEVVKRDTVEKEFDIFFDSRSQEDVDYLLGLNQYGRKINYMMQWWI